MTGGLGAVPRARGRRPVPDDAAGLAARDQRDTLLGRPLEIERLREAAWMERVVRDRDLWIEDRLADPSGEEASFLEQPERAEGVEGEVLQQVGEGVRLEDGAVVARLELGSARRAPAFLDCLAGNSCRIDSVDP